jgi:hypothetical protein
VPWVPELFSVPALQQIQDRRRVEHVTLVPFFDGLLTGEVNALVGSFAGVPELHHPVRGRIRGERAFRQFVGEMSGWLADGVTVRDVNVAVAQHRGVDEVVLDVNGAQLPVATAAEHAEDGRIGELRLYYSGWPLTGRHANRPPLLQPDPDLELPDVVGEYHRALATGDVEAAVACFAPDGYVREPGGDAYLHRGPDALRAHHERAFSNGGGIVREPCAITDDGRVSALEYNMVAWGATALLPEAGVAVYVRDEGSDRLAAARVYDDVDPPIQG